MLRSGIDAVTMLIEPDGKGKREKERDRETDRDRVRKRENDKQGTLLTVVGMC